MFCIYNILNIKYYVLYTICYILNIMYLTRCKYIRSLSCSNSGETDTPETANELGRLLQGLLCHVNVIPLNPTKGYGGRPTSKV